MTHSSRLKYQVIHRDGRVEPLDFGKIITHLDNLCNMSPELDNSINPQDTAIEFITKMADNTTTDQIDDYSAEFCASRFFENPDYLTLAARIIVSAHTKNLRKYNKDLLFSDVIEMLNDNTDLNGNPAETLDNTFYNLVIEHKDIYNKMIQIDRDYLFDFFGFKTLAKSYLAKINVVKILPDGTKDITPRIVESPQHMYLRTAICIHGANFERVQETYDLLSLKIISHATPTLFNAGMAKSQLLSCFLLGMEDSMNGIYKCLMDTSAISKLAGGIGIHISDIRAEGTYIKGTNGRSDGLLPMLRVFNCTSEYVNQGGKRKGSIAMYVEPWHADIYVFLECKLPRTQSERSANGLFYALWIPDLFMKCVENNEPWYLMCPHDSPGLTDCHSEEFEYKYKKYVSEGKYKKKISATDLFNKILVSQRETGTPYMLYKDSVNRKSNHMNIGTIKSSNLCVGPETRILTSKGYYHIANLVDQDIEVWNGEEWSLTSVLQTGVNQKLLKVTLSNGSIVHCTEYHKFIIETGSRPQDKSVALKVEAKDLKEDMKLIKHDLPIIDNDLEFKYAYTHGLFCSEGTYCHTKYGPEDQKRHARITLYGPKKDLLDHLDIRTTSGEVTANDSINVMLPYDIQEKFEVPINYGMNSKLRWFEGVCDGDGTVARNGTNESIQITSIHTNYLMNMQFMLQTMGIASKVSKSKDARKTMMPDGKGGKQEYDCKETYRLLLTSGGTQKLLELGFNPKRLQITKRIIQRDATHFIKVVSVEDTGRFDNTYCFKETKRGMGMFEGVLLGNCAEIVEYSDNKKYACCCLGSIILQNCVDYDKNSAPIYTTKKKKETSLEKKKKLKTKEQKHEEKDDKTKEDIDTKEKEKEESEKAVIGRNSFNFDKLHDAVRTMTRNLDNIIDINYYPVPETFESNMSERPIGIGVQGLGDTFFALGLPFDSKEARELNKKIFETIYYAAASESIELAREKGTYKTYEGSPASKGLLQFDLWSEKDEGFVKPTDANYNWTDLKKELAKYGLRNSMLTACMPTASTAQIAGTIAEAVEPATYNMYTRAVNSGNYSIINHYLINDIRKLPNFKSILNHIKKNRGSVQDKALRIPVELKELYKTSFEVKQKVLIDLSADRGPFIDQSQSLNLFFNSKDEDMTKKLGNAHMYGFKRGLKTGSYYIRSEAGVNADTMIIEDKKYEEKEKKQEEDCDMCGA